MLRKAFAVCLIALASQAHAGLVVIDSSIGTYSVGYIQAGGGQGGSRLLENLANDFFMPWFGNLSLAVEFAGLVGDRLGFPNGETGPFFLATDPEFSLGAAFFRGQDGGPGTVSLTGFNPDFPANYALASKVTTSVAEPGTLTLFGAGLLGLGLLRLRRHKSR
jgi:PEP-CTERM motif